jgi:hypothetical protein
MATEAQSLTAHAMTRHSAYANSNMPFRLAG